MSDVQHVFIIGAKGLGNYGGYETFVDKLTEYHQNNQNIKYHVACKKNGQGFMDETKLKGEVSTDDMHFTYHNASCYKVAVPEKIGAAQAIYYDIHALKQAISYCKKKSINHPIFYILACRIGPFIGPLVMEIHAMGGKLYVNPDGHEWMRAKWSKPVREYWRESEKLMVKHADLLICDSVNIEKYIKKTYKKYKPKTIFIAYGADVEPSKYLNDEPRFTGWMAEHELRPNEYYLIVGRFVPENNFETMIREFMKSDSNKDLVIITTKNDRFLSELDANLHFSTDKRVKFVGTVYNVHLLKKIRENAYGYFHGHSVGGTNPSLLEALSSTNLNLLLDVGFNREVALESALYWNKKPGSLASLIESADKKTASEISELGNKAKQRIIEAYSWKAIADKYEHLFLG